MGYQYEIKWKELCKMASKEKVDKFNEKFEELKVVFKLENKDIDVDDLFLYFYDKNCDSDFNDDFQELNEKVNDLEMLFNGVIEDFRKTTEINVGMEFEIDEFNQVELPVFVLEWHDMVQLTPKAIQLRDNKVGFSLSERSNY